MRNLQDFFMKGLLQVALLLSLCFASAHGQTTYTWSLANNGNWNVATNWDVGSNYPVAGDTAILHNTGGYTITYNVAGGGSVATLNFYKDSSATATDTTLQLNTSLTITSSGTMYDLSSGGGIYIKLANSANLIIASGATFTMGSATGSTRSYTNITAAAGYTGTGVLVDGTLLLTNNTTGTWVQAANNNAPYVFRDGSTLEIDSTGTGGNTRMLFYGNFTSTGNVTIKGVGPGTPTIYMMGDVSISSGTTITGFSAQNIIIASNSTATSATTQNVAFGNLYNYKFRSQSSNYNATWKVSSTAVDSNSTSNAINGLYFQLAAGTSSVPLTSTFQLQSNLNLAAGQSNFIAGFTSAAYSTLNLDLNGHNYDMTAGGSTSTFTGSYGTAVAGQYFKFSNSGTSALPTYGASPTSGSGIFRAAAFNFASSNVLVGDGVILEATSITGSSDLGAPTSLVDATTTSGVSAKSTYYYSGNNSSTGAAYLGTTGGRAIGKVIVGTSAGSTSKLVLNTNITGNGDLIINTGSLLDIYGHSYTLGKDGTVGASLLTSGTATLRNNSSTLATVSFATDATTAGKLSPGGDGAVGVIVLSSTQNSLTVDLNSATLFIDVLSASSYDYLQHGGGTTLKLAGSNIYLNFLDGSLTSGTIDIFQGSSNFTTDGGTPTITSNIDGTFTFNNTTGELMFTLVPEPGTVALLVMGGLALAGTAFARRKLHA